MHALPITHDIISKVQIFTLRSLVTMTDLSNTPITAITDGDTTYHLHNVRVARLPLASLAPHQLAAIGVTSHDVLVRTLHRNGHPACLDSVVSLVSWERLASDNLPCTETYTSGYYAPNAIFEHNKDGMRLDTFVSPLHNAQDGDVLAFSLPYSASHVSIRKQAANPKTIRVLRTTTNGAVVAPLHTMPDPFVQRALMWARHAIRDNGERLFIANNAVRRARAYSALDAFDADVFFWTDRVTVVADAPHRLVVMALGADTLLPASAHHSLANHAVAHNTLHALRRPLYS